MNPIHARPLIALAALAAWTTSLSAGEADGGDKPRRSPGVSIKVSDEHIDFLVGTDVVSRYHKGADVAKPYFWPVAGPGGVALTRAWPMVESQAGQSSDHPHQKSAWFCHGDVIPEGVEVRDRIKGIEGVDFWSETRGHGRIVCTQVQNATVAGSHGRIPTHNEWRTADGVKILDEERTIHLYDFGDTRLFVLDIDLYAGVCPVTFGDTKEGSMGVRVSDRITEEKRVGKKVVQGAGKIENAPGQVGEKACWGRVSDWCDYSGPIDDKVVGLAILADPSNKYPSCWHSRGYGLMAANPFGRARSGFPAMKGRTDLVKLAKGEHLQLRYGLLLHPGDARDGKVADYYQRFVKLREK
jgi:hypothetical protein